MDITSAGDALRSKYSLRVRYARDSANTAEVFHKIIDHLRMIEDQVWYISNGKPRCNGSII